LSIPDCHISNVLFLCMSMSVSLDCPFLIVPSLTSFSCVCQCQCLWIVHSWLSYLYRLFLVYVNVSVSRLSIPDCPISNVCYWHWHTQEKDVRDGTIRNGQSRDTDIDIQKKKKLEMWQSGMGNPETLTLTYTRKRRVSDCPFLIVTSLASFSCWCQCQCL
jgi:hypothetical protein